MRIPITHRKLVDMDIRLNDQTGLGMVEFSIVSHETAINVTLKLVAARTKIDKDTGHHTVVFKLDREALIKAIIALK